MYTIGMENGSKPPTTVDVSTARSFFDELATKLEAQAKEIEDATKVLQLQATNNSHDAHANQVRSDQLDQCETEIATARQQATDMLEEARRIRNDAIIKRNGAQEQLSINEMRKIDLDKREAFLLRKEQEVDMKMKRLNDRTQLLERNVNRMSS